MDDDDYGDILDEDLILAYNELAETRAAVQTNNAPLSNPPPQMGLRPTLSLTTVPSFGEPLTTPPPQPDKVPPSKPSLAGPLRTNQFANLQNASGERRCVADHGGLFDANPPSSFRPTGPGQSFRQTTLWGQSLAESLDTTQPQSSRNTRPYRTDLGPEIPTHHILNPDSLNTWVYPMNLGPIRDYQFSIVKHGLFNNTLVALPTGLGKTFIAATVMLNFFRWTKSAKIVFVAPTKPLVAQQVDACLNVAGIPRSQATRLDGDVPPVVREGEWECKRLFFMTPQTLLNDLSKGYADPKSIVLLVVDEAHRATGEYAYVKVVEFLRRFSQSFRVLALTATPGSTVESVQDVINHLGISHVEIRTEESLDIRQYVHSRNIETVVLEPSDEMMHIRDLFSRALKPLVDKLSSQNIYWGRDPMALTTYGLLKARADWMSGAGRHVNQGTKFMMFAVFSILQSLAHSIKLLNFHGIKPFYNNIVDFRRDVEEKGEGGSKYKRQLLSDPSFQEMMDTIEKWLKLDNFVGHPKIAYLCDTLLNHFMDAGEGSVTRAIVFSEYRDSAEEIVRVLNNHRPLVRAAVFVGQADSRRSEGMKQKQQIETIERFKTGDFNVLVATSVGEEGLDIGQVDLIVCYDASASPIRMLQRMGRTGRKRMGNIVLLLMKGKEEDQFARAKDNYENIQRLICDGSHFELRHDLSSRILPRDLRPEVEMRHVEIPFENTQSKDLLDPKKTSAALRRKPSAKKFNMPDGVEKGFVKASLFGRTAGLSAEVPKGGKNPRALKRKAAEPLETESLVNKPDIRSILLSDGEIKELNNLYRVLPFQMSNSEDINGPNLTAFPVLQRTLRPTVKLRHGEYTRRCVALFARLGRPSSFANLSEDGKGRPWKELPVPPFAESSDDESLVKGNVGSSRKRPRSDLSLGRDDCERAVPSKRSAYGASRGAPSRRQKNATSFLDECAFQDHDEDGDVGIDEAELPAEGIRSRGRPTVPARAKYRRKRPQIWNRLRRTGDHLEELGDDCERTSDVEETDGSDSGADLVDFIVEDDDMTSSMLMTQSSISQTTCSSPIELQRPVAASKHYHNTGQDANYTTTKPVTEALGPSPTQDSDDMPHLDELAKQSCMGNSGQRRSFLAIMDNESDDSTLGAAGGDGRRTATSKRQRPVVRVSDDE